MEKESLLRISGECGGGKGRKQNSMPKTPFGITKSRKSMPKVPFSSTVCRDIPTECGFSITKVLFGSTVCGDIPTERRLVVLFHTKERCRRI